ncbi:MAG: efflux RND transporter periplasmic adaptor subunit [Terriglobia bacterium]
MKASLIFPAGFVLLLYLSGCGGRTSHETPKETAPAPIPVKTEVAILTEGPILFKAPGTVKSVTVASLSSKVMGTIQDVKVRAGDRVQKGQLLIIVDSRETDAMVQKALAGQGEAVQALQEMDQNIESAEFNVKLATTTLKRYEELASQKSVSPQEFDEVKTKQQSAASSLEALRARRKQVEARVRQAESDVQAARALLSYTQITSPLSGVVVARLVEPGMLSAPGGPLLVVEETNQYQLELTVEEGRIARLKPGQALAVRIPSLPSPDMTGTITEVQPAADPSSRTFTVKVKLPPQPQLRTGIYGEAFFEGGKSKGIWIPSASILHQGQLEGVYVVEKDHRARLRLLKLGETTSRGVEVLSGLEGGEIYVTELRPGLCDGCPVEGPR